VHLMGPTRQLLVELHHSQPVQAVQPAGRSLPRMVLRLRWPVVLVALVQLVQLAEMVPMPVQVVQTVVAVLEQTAKSRSLRPIRHQLRSVMQQIIRRHHSLELVSSHYPTC